MHAEFLHQALLLAETRRGFCAPNPSVGAVLVRDQQVLATGCHWQAGAPHAEVVAINQLPPNATDGASLYVTLEPCSHYGKTPPCVSSIIDAGIKAVYYSETDPNPAASNGAEELRRAGVRVEQISLPAISDFYASYRYWLQHQRPWLTAKIALSLDGKLAGPNGAPVQLTAEKTNTWTHQRRFQSDAILSSVNTVLKDDPKLNVRLNDTTVAKPVYLLDTACRMPLNATVLTTAQSVTVFCADTALAEQKAQLRKRGVRVVEIPSTATGLDLIAATQQIGQDGVMDVWVECGATLLTALLEQALVQTFHVLVAPHFLGSLATSADLPVFHFAAEAKSLAARVVGVDTIYTMQL